jgi:hypothetical protein
MLFYFYISYNLAGNQADKGSLIHFSSHAIDNSGTLHEHLTILMVVKENAQMINS